MSTSTSKVLKDLASRIRNERVVFFLGAGASWDIPSGLPTSFELIEQLAKRIALPMAGLLREDLIRRLTRDLRFEVFMQIAISILGPRAIDALRVLEEGKPNYNHVLTAEIAMAGWSSLVLTTNFDSLLEQAAFSHRLPSVELIFRPIHFKNDFKPDGLAFRIAKLHGSLRDLTGRLTYDSIAISSEQVGRALPGEKARTLKQILRNRDIVFLGYSGLDDFDLFPLILSTESERSIFWINHTNSPRLSSRDSAYIASNLTSRSSNPEKIVSSRNDSYIIRGQTRSFIARLRELLFGKGRPLTTIASSGPRPKNDYSYLDAWAKSVHLDKHQAVLNGQLLLKLEDPLRALECFNLALSENPMSALALLGKSTAMRRSGQTGPARDILESLLRRSDLPSELQARIQIEAGLLECEQMNLDAARRYLSPLVRRKQTKASSQIDAHNNLGMAALLEAEKLFRAAGSKAEIGALAKAANSHFQAAKKLIGIDGDPRKLANLHGNIALSLGFLHRFRTAERHYKEALRIFRSLISKGEEAACLTNMSHHYKEWSKEPRVTRLAKADLLQKALRLGKDSHRLKLRFGTPRRIAISKHLIGEIYRLQGRHKLARRWLKGALIIFTEQGLNYYADQVRLEIERSTTSHGRA